MRWCQKWRDGCNRCMHFIGARSPLAWQNFFSPSLDHLTDSANPEKKILEEALHTSPSLPALQVVIRTLRLRLLTPPEWQTLDPEGISFRNWNTPD
jgi:hypothetical protein